MEKLRTRAEVRTRGHKLLPDMMVKTVNGQWDAEKDSPGEPSHPIVNAHSDENLYSTTIDRTQKGRGFVNIMAHDPPTKSEVGQAPAMEPMKHFGTAEQASEAAATRAQSEYDAMRNDPSSDWFVPNRGAQ